MSCSALDIPFQGEYFPPPIITPSPPECAYLVLSGLPRSDAQFALLGTYERLHVTNLDRPVYSQISGANFLYAFSDRLWVVGKVIGEDDGGILVWDMATEPKDITASWQAFNGKEWVFVPNFRAECVESHEIDSFGDTDAPIHTISPTLAPNPSGDVQEVLCQKFELRGLPQGHRHHFMMGTFAMLPESKDGRPAYAQVQGRQFVFSMMEGKIWAVGAQLGVDDVGMLVWDVASEPHLASQPWQVWNGSKWVPDHNVKAVCVS